MTASNGASLLESGVLIDDIDLHYRVDGTCGSGTSGTVLLATDREDGSQVAIKVFEIGGGDCGQGGRKQSPGLTRLGCEVAALRRCGSHRHIVKMRKLLYAKTRAFLVLEFIPGADGAKDLLGTPVARLAPARWVNAVPQMLFAHATCRK